MSYWQASNTTAFTLEVKKSRFIALAYPCSSREQAMNLLQQVESDYPDARHHCWAYVIGDPDNAAAMAFGDAGEPAGTAGRPILNVLQHKHIGDLMLIVVRYFGGIKLGAGGLTRAYGQAADGAVQALQLSKPVIMQRWQVRCDFAREQFLRYWLDQHGGELLQVDYAEQVLASVNLPESTELPDEQLAAQGIELSPPGT